MGGWGGGAGGRAVCGGLSMCMSACVCVRAHHACACVCVCEGGGGADYDYLYQHMTHHVLVCRTGFGVSGSVFVFVHFPCRPCSPCPWAWPWT